MPNLFSLHLKYYLQQSSPPSPALLQELTSFIIHILIINILSYIVTTTSRCFHHIKEQKKGSYYQNRSQFVPLEGVVGLRLTKFLTNLRKNECLCAQQGKKRNEKTTKKKKWQKLNPEIDKEVQGISFREKKKATKQHQIMLLAFQVLLVLGQNQSIRQKEKGVDRGGSGPKSISNLFSFNQFLNSNH